MSASEKLNALGDFGPPSHYDEMHRLQDVFPQIVAVVEAAESVKDLWGGYAGNPEQAIQRSEVRLGRVLAALDEALSSK